MYVAYCYYFCWSVQCWCVVVVVAAVGIITVLYYVYMLDGINNYVVDIFHFPANAII